MNDHEEQELFTKLAATLSGRPLDVVCSMAINLIVNVIRQSEPSREKAEAVFDECFGRAKSLLLEKHYDTVTGKRREVMVAGATQVLEMPFLGNTNTIFPARRS